MLKKKLEELKGRTANCRRNGTASIDGKKFPHSLAASENKHNDMLRMLQEKLEEERTDGSSQKDSPLTAYIRKENGGNHTHKVMSSKDNSAKEGADVIDSYLHEDKWHAIREENGYHMMKGSIWAMVSRHETLAMSRLFTPTLHMTRHDTLPCDYCPTTH